MSSIADSKMGFTVFLTKLTYIACFFGMGLLLAGPKYASANNAQLLGLKAKIFMKIATYDAALPQQTLNIGIVYPDSHQDYGETAVAAFEAISSMTVKGRNLSIFAVEYSSPADLRSALANNELFGVFVTQATPNNIVQLISKLAKNNKLFTFADNSAHVNLGLATGVELSNAKRAILVNTSAAIGQGRKLDGEFLKLCTIVN